MPVLLVRHAHALSRSEWKHDDAIRELSERGRKQSAALAGVLGAFAPSRLISSPYLRCMDTLRPLAVELGVGVEADEALAEGSSVAALLLVRDVMSDTVVLCSHGDVIPRLLNQLSVEDRFDIGKNPRNEKASVWVLHARKAKFTKAEYLRPPR